MNAQSTPDDDALAQAQRELAVLTEQIRQARAQLRQLEGDIAQARDRRDDGDDGKLLAINQQLVLAMLRCQIDAENAADSLQEALQDALRQGQGENQQRHAQLNEANERLVLAAIGAQELQAAAEQARQRQTELLALVAHELRHPLAPIRNAAAVLGRLPQPPPGMDRMRAIIEQQVAHMARLVGDLLDTTRATTGKLRMELRRIDLVPVVGDALEACQPALDARQQRLVRPELPASLPLVGDAGRLAQVFSNLLDNASKYTPHGGRILVTVERLGDSVVVAVSDSGIGITAEALPRVFEPFVQDLHATVFNGVGLGLGLTVVRELVEAHGGSVVATSDGAGLGSRFVVTLPLAGDPG